MNLISVENLSKAYGEKIIFDNLTFGIDDTDKIGVIGVNGTGKSTLLKIIAGEEEADSGNVITMNGLRVGYLPQSPVFKKGEVVMDYMIRICKITNADEESKAKTVLTKIGINDFYADVDTLSGGQKKRVAIGAAMISPVDLLILDEPTNHIDSETIAWMENNLKSTTNNSPTINSARCRQIRKTKSGTKNWIMNTNGNTIAMDVIGNPL